MGKKNKFVILVSFLWCVLFSGNVFADAKKSDDDSVNTRVYVGINYFTGVYNIREVNEPTNLLNGLAVNFGSAIPVLNTISWRIEGVYNLGYKASPHTNYSSFGFRTGFEFAPSNYNIIPYFLVGGGVVGFDPDFSYVQTGGFFNAMFGLRIPIFQTWNINTGLDYQSANVRSRIGPGRLNIDRAGFFFGFSKNF